VKELKIKSYSSQKEIAAGIGTTGNSIYEG
jgi:hypothetical protein